MPAQTQPHTAASCHPNNHQTQMQKQLLPLHPKQSHRFPAALIALSFDLKFAGLADRQLAAIRAAKFDLKCTDVVRSHWAIGQLLPATAIGPPNQMARATTTPEKPASQRPCAVVSDACTNL